VAPGADEESLGDNVKVPEKGGVSEIYRKRIPRDQGSVKGRDDFGI
jgi:hypothetical protein